MKITLKLYAGLGDYLPNGARRNAIDLEIPSHASPHDIIDRYGLPRESAHLVLLNGIYLLPNERDKPLLSDGDTLAVWPAVAGG